jgi:hypothetical protein
VAPAVFRDPAEEEKETDPVFEGPSGDNFCGQMVEGMSRIVPGGGQTDPVQRILFYLQ